MGSFYEIVGMLENKSKKYRFQSYMYLLATIPFMIFTLLIHKLVFLEFGFILFAFGLYSIKQIINVNEELVLIEDLSKKIKSNKIHKIYPEGHHMIANPTNAILDLGGYVYVGKDDRGTKFYQNITDVVVLGKVNPINGEVIYDDFGIPTFLFNQAK